jgi:cbb3-type cytochrome oxidase subunit 3
MQYLYLNGKILMLVLLLIASGALLLYLFGNRKRGRRLESYRDIPLDDDEPPAARVDKNERSKDQ